MEKKQNNEQMIQLTLVAIQDIFVALSGTRMRFEIKKKAKGKKQHQTLVLLLQIQTLFVVKSEQMHSFLPTCSAPLRAQLLN